VKRIYNFFVIILGENDWKPNQLQTVVVVVVPPLTIVVVLQLLPATIKKAFTIYHTVNVLQESKHLLFIIQLMYSKKISIYYLSYSYYTSMTLQCQECSEQRLCPPPPLPLNYTVSYTPESSTSWLVIII